ncbi:unnamed protein product [Cyprideis torosa]|uniref:Uncharacterized protein n=1 Tax=Cyprideis torosa TaxID=163714 RepID=A0A7R8W4F7_9CRUS|nr:unnamed protein product [Cyprideis torosa]CAG0878739.1 unnamed protein product [Cyprideis torosa]
MESESEPEENRYVFAYTVTIRNNGKIPAKLLTRHWVITDANGKVQEVKGEGVVGETPHLKPGEGFQYTSGTMLETSMGTMGGSYQMVTDDGTEFDATIPDFLLTTPLYTGHRDVQAKDTLTDILESPDIEELIHWLRFQPLMLYSKKHDAVLTHAGLHPEWDLKTAQKEANAVQLHLRSHDYKDIFGFMYGNKPTKWKPGRIRKKRLRFAINCFTRMRYCSASGKLDFEEKGPPGSQPSGLLPWYELPNKLSKGTRIIFGHWSTVGDIENPNIINVDTGCVWGGKLTAYELESGRYHHVKCPQAQKIS